jgi:hypothetical protein
MDAVPGMARLNWRAYNPPVLHRWGRRVFSFSGGNIMAVKTITHHITLADVQAAREAFETNEPRDLFYRSATELVGLALREPHRLAVADALAILLQTWNKNFYRFHKAFDLAHFAEIDGLLVKHQAELKAYRERKIEDLSEADAEGVQALFEDFEAVLGPVGSAKALHLLAPTFFPLWDRTIAKKYGVPLDGTYTKSGNYWSFMLTSKRQSRELIAAGYTGNTLKAIDEWNYCHLSKEWI